MHNREPTAGDNRATAQAMLETGNKIGAVLALIAEADANPTDATLHADICSLLGDLGELDAAIGAGFTALQHGPENALANAALGRALYLSAKPQEALEYCARAVVLAPQNVGGIVTFGAVLFTLGFHQEALSAAQEALLIEPRHFQARANLALALEALGRIDDAEVHSRAALAAEPGNVLARHNLAGLLLVQGKLDAEAWGLYESRLGLTPLSRAIAAIPRWAGEAVAGRTVLLHAEQGAGDVIQFVRYAPMVAARGARVVLAVPPNLMRLLQGVSGVDDVVPAGGVLPPYDVFCPLASLPGIFGTTLASIPAPVPYLAAPPDALERFGRPASRLLQVGLVWAGGTVFGPNHLRSIAPAEMAVLEGVPGVVFHSLQMPGTPPFAMQDQMAKAVDFADTAAIVAGLDLIIAVDTAVAHLAGAMGKPVWLLSRAMGCWRWLRDRSDTPWYPTMRIFRQTVPREWLPVLAEVREALVVVAADRVRSEREALAEVCL